jgi:hypothetical protein
MRRPAAFVVLLAFDVYTAVTLVNAVLVSDGHGPVFWTAICLIALLLTGALWLTARVGKPLRRRFRANAIPPS